MRWLILAFYALAAPVFAQSVTVLPHELTLEVIVENPERTPYVGEMVLITIRGEYRRHITREDLRQPDFAGFNWSQLGPDTWREERDRGQKFKILERRMAIFPKRAGTLTVAPFVHRLTLTDANDDWFEHDIQSNAFTIQVAPLPPEAEGTWWFPTRSLKVSDQWSNAPDQLQPGEGVLRIVHLEAVGVTPDMIPPMPELTSPSAMIFPHPEKRLVELSPRGPVTHAFWRWTLRPTNDTSGVLEPLEVPYFNTETRKHETVKISATRVAYAERDVTQQVAQVLPQARLPGWPVLIAALLVFVAVLVPILWGRHFTGRAGLRQIPLFDPLAWRMTRAARRGDAAAVRRLAAERAQRDGTTADLQGVLSQLDRVIFDPLQRTQIDLRTTARQLLRYQSVQNFSGRS